MGYDFTHDLNCPGGSAGGPGGGFGGPGGGFNSNRSSGKPLLRLLLRKPPPGPPKPQPGPPTPPPGQFRSCVKSHPTYFWGTL